MHRLVGVHVCRTSHNAIGESVEVAALVPAEQLHQASWSLVTLQFLLQLAKVAVHAFENVVAGTCYHFFERSERHKIISVQVDNLGFAKHVFDFNQAIGRVCTGLHVVKHLQREIADFIFSLLADAPIAVFVFVDSKLDGFFFVYAMRQTDGSNVVIFGSLFLLGYKLAHATFDKLLFAVKHLRHFVYQRGSANERFFFADFQAEFFNSHYLGFFTVGCVGSHFFTLSGKTERSYIARYFNVINFHSVQGFYSLSILV